MEMYGIILVETIEMIRIVFQMKIVGNKSNK